MKKLIATILLLATIITLLPIMPVSAAEESWRDGWEVTAAKIEEDKFGWRVSPVDRWKDKVKLLKNIPAVTDADYTMIMTVEEWEESVDDWTNQSYLDYLIFLGQRRIQWRITEDGIQPVGSSGWMSKIPYEIGTGTHTYRAVASGDNCKIIIDGKTILEYPMEIMQSTARIDYRTSNVTLIDYLGETSKMDGAGTSADDKEEETPKLEHEATLPQTKSFFYDFNDGEPYLEGWEGVENWKQKDGMISVDVDMTGGGFNSFVLQDPTFNPRGDFTWSMRIRAGVFNFIQMKTLTKGIRTQWRVSQSNSWIQTVSEVQIARFMGFESTDFAGFYDWHEYKIESFNNGRYYRYYIDNKLVGEDRGYDYGHGINDPDKRYLYLALSTGSNCPAEFDIDWMKLETGLNKDLGLVMVSPKEKYVNTGEHEPATFPEYVEGKDIPLQAKLNIGFEDRDVPYVDYKMNGKAIARGYAPDYKAVFKNAPAGSHSVAAEYEDLTTHEVYFDVLPKLDAELKVTKPSNDKLNLSVKVAGELKSVSEVEFLVDGQVVATDKAAPYSATVQVTPESHNVAAIVRNASGQALDTVYQNVDPSLGNKMSVNYSNEIRYTVSGNKGTATVDVSNGTHRVFMTHKANEVTMLTLDGEETHPYGPGEYIVITNGPTVDVYRNGQFAFSCYLPKTTAVEKKSKDNGLKVTNLNVSIPEVRDNYFVKRKVTDKQKVYDLQGLDEFYHNYNLDFVANKNNNARLVLQDGYYVTDITVENGEISCQTAIYNGNDPEKFVIGKLPEDGSDAYVRISVVDGMALALVDGKWVNSFRCANALGEQMFGIDVTKGELPYISVNRHEDYFLFEDDFKGKGEFESLDYWAPTKLEVDVDKEEGQMTLYSSGEGYALLSAFVDNVDLSTEIKINNAKGMVGFRLGDTTALDIYQTIGYNFKTQQYEFVEKWKTSVRTTTAPGKLPIGKKIKMELKIRHDSYDKYFDLIVDGKTVLTANGSNLAKNRGRVGVLVNNAVVNLTSVKFAGDSRTHALTRTILDMSRGGHGASGPNYADGSFIDASGYTTYDGGETWTYVNRPVGGETAASYHFTPDGTLVTIRGDMVIDEKGNYRFDRKVFNSDDVNNPEKTLVAELPFMKASGLSKDADNTGERLRIGPSGRLFWTSDLPSHQEEDGRWIGHTEQSGNAGVFYSDDNGKTWHMSETVMTTEEVGSVINEGVAMELPNGIVRHWFRSNRGWIRYMDSYDGGKTFDTENIKTTPFFSQANCYSIKYGYKTYNSYDYNTLYITWGYDDYNQDARVSMPRTRYAMARSTDGGETWEFLGTFWEKNFDNAAVTNMNVWMGESRDYLYAAADTGPNDESDGQKGARMVVDKRGLKGTKAFEVLHVLCDYPVGQVTNIMPRFKVDRVLAVNETTGNAALQAERLEGVVTGGAILVDVAATFVGACLGKAADGSVTFTRNEEVVTFDASKITRKGGKQYVSISAFAEAYGYNVEKVQDITFVSQFGGWSDGQVDAFRYATDVFAQMN